MSQAGYLYIMSDGSGAVKVGLTRHNDATRRRRELQTGNPAPLVLHAVIKVCDPREVERLAHEELETYRLVGEWFCVDVSTALWAVIGLAVEFEPVDRLRVFTAEAAAALKVPPRQLTGLSLPAIDVIIKAQGVQSVSEGAE